MSRNAHLEATPRHPSPKRGVNERGGLHAWLPYYAGFSEAFVEDVIDRLRLPAGSLVFDPMGGSGTTSCVAQRMRMQALTTDLNPVAVVISRAKDAALARPRELHNLVSRALQVVERLNPQPESDSPRSSPPSHLSHQLFRSALSILHASTTTRLSHAPRLKTIAAYMGAGRLSPLAIMEASLLLYIRKAFSATRTKNPSWLKCGSRNRQTNESFAEEWAHVTQSCVRDLVAYFGTFSPISCSLSMVGDARALRIPSSSVDAIITSPPYLTRIDYTAGTLPELHAMGFDSEPRSSLRALRVRMMGTPCIRASHPVPDGRLGGRLLQLLEDIRTHQSYAAESYYWKTIVQYFNDAYAVIREVARVLRKGGHAAVVVQDTWFKDVYINLAEWYLHLAQRVALKGRIDRSEEVRRSLTAVNPYAHAYPKGAVQEHVLILTKT